MQTLKAMHYSLQFACLLSAINSQVSSCVAHSNECVVAGINADRNDHREKWNTCMLYIVAEYFILIK